MIRRYPNKVHNISLQYLWVFNIKNFKNNLDWVQCTNLGYSVQFFQPIIFFIQRGDHLLYLIGGVQHQCTVNCLNLLLLLYSQIQFSCRFWYQNDKYIFSGPNLPSSVHLPKVENLDHLEWFAAELNSVIARYAIN